MDRPGQPARRFSAVLLTISMAISVAMLMCGAGLTPAAAGARADDPAPPPAGRQWSSLDAAATPVCGVLSPGASPEAERAIKHACDLVGTPYSWGGGHGPAPGLSYGLCDPANNAPNDCHVYGLDCTGFTRYAYYLATGLDMGRGSTYTRWYTDPAVARFYASDGLAPLLPGDLLYFGDSASTTHHTAIYLGNGYIVEAPFSGGHVRVNSFTAHGDYFGAVRPYRPGPPVSGVDYSASSVVEFNGELTVFARGGDGSLQHWWLEDGQANQHDVWSDAGSVAGRPVVVAYRGMLNVFYRGVDGSLQHWWFDGQAHHDVWGGGVLAGDPTAAVFGGMLTVFGRGADGALHNWWLVHGQANQHAVWGGGSLAGNPTAVVYNGILSVFGRGTDNALHNWWITNGRANQHAVWGGGSLAGDPTAAVLDGTLSVFGRGTDGAVHNWWIEQGRANQHSVWGGGSLAGNPAVTVYNGMLSVFGRGVDGALHNWWIVNGQANQHSVWGGGSLTNDPQATLFANGSILSVFGRADDGGLHNWWIVNGQANQHSPWGGGNIAR